MGKELKDDPEYQRRVAALILLCTKVPVGNVIKTRTFEAGAAAIIGIFGLAWMGDTFIKGNEKAIVGAISDVANAYPPLFGLFVASVFLYS